MEAVIGEGAKVHLAECSRVLVFDSGNEVLYSSFPVCCRLQEAAAPCLPAAALSFPLP